MGRGSLFITYNDDDDDDQNDVLRISLGIEFIFGLHFVSTYAQPC